MAGSSINLGGKTYDSTTGEPIRDLKNSKSARDFATKPAAETLNRQYVSKPNLMTKPKFVDGFAKSRPQISGFRRAKPTLLEIAKIPTEAITHFNVGDYNPTSKPIVISHQKNQDVVVSREQHDKFLKALSDARRTGLPSHHLANQIARSRRQRTNKVHETSFKLASRIIKPATIITSTPAKLNSVTAEANRQAKNSAINQALALAPSSAELEKTVKRDRFLATLKPTKPLIITAIAITFILSYLVYLNLPNISLSIASREAGVGAVYPAYRPEGFILEKYPEVKSCGDTKCIEMWFINADKQSIKFTQFKSSWDSQAVLENSVKPLVGDNYTIFQEQGLTIYNYDNNKTTWVNGGVLYKIESSASVSSEQLRRIATSL